MSRATASPKSRIPLCAGSPSRWRRRNLHRKARALTAEPYGTGQGSGGAALRTSQYSKFENPTGIFFEEGEDVLLVMGDPKGEKLNLVIHNLGGTEATAPIR